jgi:hypothetical protein
LQPEGYHNQSADFGILSTIRKTYRVGDIILRAEAKYAASQDGEELHVDW